MSFNLFFKPLAAVLTLMLNVVFVQCVMAGEWSEYTQIERMTVTATGDVIIEHPQTHTPNPGGCKLNMYLLKTTRPGFNEQRAFIQGAYFFQEQVRVYVLDTCSSDGLYKQFSWVQTR